MDGVRIADKKTGRLLLSIEPLSSEQLMPRYFSAMNNPFIHKILDSIPNIVFILNKNQKIVFANDSFLKFSGVACQKAVRGMYPGQALGCAYSSFVQGGCGASRQCSRCCLFRSPFDQKLCEGRISECRLVRKDGTSVEVRVWSTGFMLDENPYFFFSIIDVSDEKRKRVLEKIFYHDLLNTVGCMYSTVSLMKQVSLDKYGRLTDIILESSKMLIDEIEAQLELSAAENKELSIHPERINSLWLLYQVASQYKNHRAAKNRTITVDSESEEFEFISDRIMSRRVLGNMAKNALEAVETCQTVSLGCRMSGEKAVFWVHNPGTIPEKVKEQIFSRACSTKGKGRGIGTYSIKLLTERYLGGRADFETSSRNGTRFQLILPLDISTADSGVPSSPDYFSPEVLNREMGGIIDGIIAEKP